MTNQVTFDTVVRAIFAQGRPSVIPAEGCAYRSNDGCRCAAGHLIPDTKYDPKFEGAACWVPAHASDALEANRVSRRVASVLMSEGHDPEFVKELQVAHDEAAAEHETDNAAFIGAFTFKARQIALNHGLSLEVFG
jgi:hypothetical protein